MKSIKPFLGAVSKADLEMWQFLISCFNRIHDKANPEANFPTPKDFHKDQNYTNSVQTDTGKFLQKGLNADRIRILLLFNLLWPIVDV